jgi:PAS domain S-box-containing protein
MRGGRDTDNLAVRASRARSRGPLPARALRTALPTVVWSGTNVQQRTGQDETKRAPDAASAPKRVANGTKRRAPRARQQLEHELELRSDELRQQREWFRVTLASIVDAVFTTDRAGRVTFLNPMAERMTGWSEPEALGRAFETVAPLVDERSGAPIERPLDAVLRDGRVVTLTDHVALAHRDGTTTATTDTAAPIRDAAGQVVGAVVVVHDVTEERRAAAALREQDRRKDEFLATLAHELRNPLAPIQQAAMISGSQTATDAQKQWGHDVIQRQVRHMALLLDDLLDVSRITRGILMLRRRPTLLSAAVDAAIETVRPRLEARQHVLAVELPDPPVALDADPLRLAQVFANLLANAAKYSDERARILVHARRVGADVEVSVRDTGIGIAAPALPHVFDMFTRVQPVNGCSEGGLGIGLALTKGLVELHGGTIACHSEGVGRGSEFVVRLPCTVASALPATDVPLPEPRPRGTPTRRVLIADDNRDAALSLAMLLRSDGHEVTVVHDGAAALEAISTRDVQVAVLDIGMPRLDGYEVARAVRQRVGADVTLVALTGWGDRADRQRAHDAGFDHHFTKPVEPARIAGLLAGRSVRRAPAVDEAG